jgi:hypothetical protein
MRIILVVVANEPLYVFHDDAQGRHAALEAYHRHGVGAFTSINGKPLQVDWSVDGILESKPGVSLYRLKVGE